jgi:hypothetical protein
LFWALLGKLKPLKILIFSGFFVKFIPLIYRGSSEVIRSRSSSGNQEWYDKKIALQIIDSQSYYILKSDPAGTKLEPFNGGFEATGKYFCCLE